MSNKALAHAFGNGRKKVLVYTFRVREAKAEAYKAMLHAFVNQRNQALVYAFGNRAVEIGGKLVLHEPA